MAENEFIRRKRERAFQQRILLALEKKNQTKVWQLLNSPFVLWLLSAIVISFAGFYFTTYRECLQQANAHVDEFLTLSNELRSRMGSISKIVATSRTVDEIRERLPSIPHVNSRFKDSTIEELRHRMNRVKQYFEWIDGDPHELIRSSAIEKADDDRFWRIEYGNIEPDLANREIERLYDFLQKTRGGIEGEYLEIKLAYKCVNPVSLYKFAYWPHVQLITGATK